jgi:hypothetical protein
MIREALHSHGSFTFRAFGGSMMPIVRHGEMIRIEPLEAEQARVGDILFFATPDGRYIGHRFLRWQSAADGQRLMLTSGDTLPHLDPPHHPKVSAAVSPPPCCSWPPASPQARTARCGH